MKFKVPSSPVLFPFQLTWLKKHVCLPCMLAGTRRSPRLAIRARQQGHAFLEKEGDKRGARGKRALYISIIFYAPNPQPPICVVYLFPVCAMLKHMHNTFFTDEKIDVWCACVHVCAFSRQEGEIPFFKNCQVAFFMGESRYT